MTDTDLIDIIKPTADGTREPNPFEVLREDLVSALSLYWSTASRILGGSGIRLLDPGPEFFSLENNFFSALFLYSYYRADISKPHRILYGAVNQCLRGMVTGCDNILDNEYKRTLETDLPLQGTRFRSILDIMVSDRVLFEILLKSCETDGLPYDRIAEASSVSLRALARSGAQEAAEEGGGSGSRLVPEEVLRSVHHCKTGELFQAPWAVPAVIEDLEETTVASTRLALYQIGMGCQIMDDMVDLLEDVREGRQNYVASLIYHDSSREDWIRLESKVAFDLGLEEKRNVLFEFPSARLAAAKAAWNFLSEGTKALFGERHQYLVQPTISLLARRIRADRYLADREG